MNSPSTQTVVELTELQNFIINNLIEIFGSTAVVFALIIYFIIRFHGDLIRFGSKILAALSFFGIWFKKGSIKYDIEGIINSFSSAFNRQAKELMVPNFQLEFVKPKDVDAFVSEDGSKLILRMDFSRNNHKNVANATYNYVKSGLLSNSKRYIDNKISKSIDLNVARTILLRSRNKDALAYFDNSYLIPEQDDSRKFEELYNQIEEINKSGLLTRILLREYKDFGDKLYVSPPKEEHYKESNEFLRFVYEISIREKSDWTNLGYEGRNIKVAVILVSKTETYKLYGLSPYLNRIFRLAASGISSFYLCGRGKYHVVILEEIINSLLKHGGFKLLDKSSFVIDNNKNMCALLSLDPAGVISKTREKILDAKEKCMEIEGVIERVYMQKLDVNINGIIGMVRGDELSEDKIIDATNYFNEGDEISLKVVRFEDHKLAVFSNKGTKTDPIKRIKNNYTSDKILDAKIEKIKEGGINVVFENNDVGFIYRRDATFSRFENLMEKYSKGDIIQVIPKGFNLRFGSILLKLKDLKNPWENIMDRYSIGDKVSVIIRAIEERRVVCEVESGVEGVIYERELDWNTNDVNLLDLKVGEIMEVRILEIDSERRQLYVSRKRALDNPYLTFSREHENEIVKCKVISIINDIGVKVMFRDDIFGFIYVSHLSWDYIDDINSIIDVDAEIEVKIVGISKREDSIVASLKGVYESPLDKFLRKHDIGDVVEGEVIRITPTSVHVHIEGAPKNVRFINTKGECSGLFYVQNITHIFKQKNKYLFRIMKVEKEKNIILLSRRKYFENVKLDESGLDYSSIYKVRIIGLNQSGEYIVEHKNSFQGKLILKENRTIILGDEVDAGIARLDLSRNNVELYLA